MSKGVGKGRADPTGGRNYKKTGAGRLRVTDPEEMLAEINRQAQEVHGPAMTREYHPLVEMGIAAADPALPPKARADISNKLAEFFYAKKKAVEVEGDFARDPTIQIMVLGSDGAAVPASRAVTARMLGEDGGDDTAMLSAPSDDPDISGE